MVRATGSARGRIGTGTEGTGSNGGGAIGVLPSDQSLHNPCGGHESTWHFPRDRGTLCSQSPSPPSNYLPLSLLSCGRTKHSFDTCTATVLSRGMCGGVTRNRSPPVGTNSRHHWRRRSADVGGLHLATGNDGHGQGWVGDSGELKCVRFLMCCSSTQ